MHRPALFVALLTGTVLALGAAGVEELRPTGGLPAHIAGRFEELAACQQSRSGEYFVFDRRSHSVFTFAPRAAEARKIVQIGVEPGRLLDPTAFALAGDGTFVVADSPAGQDRIQVFHETGARLGGFSLPARTLPRLTLGGVVLNGIGTLQYTGDAILISRPEAGALITEYGADGRPRRTFGELRRTGHEDDPDLHAALNSGIPLVHPAGGFYFVFMAGEPLFRRYDAAGSLMFQRHIQGPELDELVANLPGAWPTRRAGGRELPIVTPTVRAAAVDPAGQLWVSLAVPFTYVYDERGEKRRTVQFRAAGILLPTGLFFTSGGRLLVTPGCYAFPAKPVSAG